MLSNTKISKSFSGLKIFFIASITFFLFSVQTKATIYNITTSLLSNYVTPAGVNPCDVFNVHTAFTIDGNYTFDNCNFVVDAGIQIILGAGNQITFNACHANTSSSTDTWWGIYSDDPSNKLFITNSTSGCNAFVSEFANMDQGIVLKNNAQIYCDHTVFKYNLYGIQIINSTGGTYPGVIENNEFYGTNAMLTTPTGSQFSQAGVHIENQATNAANGEVRIGSAGGNGNKFNTLLVGIECISYGLIAETNEFTDIGFNQTSAYNFYNQVGIIMHGEDQNYYILKNIFSDCYGMGVGFESPKSYLEISGNSFHNLKNENIVLQFSASAEMHVINNDFLDWGGGYNSQFPNTLSLYAINARENNGTNGQPFTQLIIQDNTMVNQGIMRGIRVSETNLASAYVLSIVTNIISHVNSGVWVTYVNRAITSDNIIDFNRTTLSTTVNCWGVRYNRNPNSTISLNTITGSGFNKLEEAGIWLHQNPTSLVSQNLLQDCGNSSFMNMAFNQGTSFYCNDLEHGTYGFHFQNVPTTGVFNSTNSHWENGFFNNPSDNVWDYTDPFWGGWTQNIRRTGGGINLDWFFRDIPNCGASAYYTPALMSGLVTPHWDCGPNHCQPPYLIANPGVDEREHFFGRALVLADSLNVSALYYNEVYSAYSFLKNNSEWLSLGTGDQAYIDFVYDMDHLNLGKYYHVEQLSRNVDSASNALAILNNMTTTNDWEALWSDVFEVYLNTWANRSFQLTGGNRSTLDNAASLNEDEFGMGVSMAHVMLDTYAEPDSIPNPYRFENISPDESIAYPNPSDGIFKLKVNGPLTFELYDIAGKSLFKKEYTQPQVEIHLPDMLPNGVYLYKVNLTESGFSKSDLLFLSK